MRSWEKRLYRKLHSLLIACSFQENLMTLDNLWTHDLALNEISVCLAKNLPYEISPTHGGNGTYVFELWVVSCSLTFRRI